MRTPARLLLPLALVLSATAAPGCVRRVHEAPGLAPGSEMAVTANMRMPSFEVDDYEVRPFRIPLSETNQRRYQFAVLRNGVHQLDYTVERLDDGTWTLLEIRPAGITLSRTSWPTEPSYATARSSVIGQLRGGGGPVG